MSLLDGVRERWQVSVAGARCDHPGEDASVHRALRHLVLACRAVRRPLPPAPAVSVDGAVVTLHLAAPMGAPPAGWRAGPHAWSVDAAALPDPGVAFDAYPALVRVGDLPSGSLFVDLGAAPGLVQIDGDSAEVRDFLLGVATALRAAPWSRRVRTTLVGEGWPQLPDETPIAAEAGTGTWRVRREVDLRSVLPAGPPDLGGVSGRWGSPPRGEHEVVLVTRLVDRGEVARVRSAARRRDAPTVVARGRGHGVWQWHLASGELTW